MNSPSLRLTCVAMNVVFDFTRKANCVMKRQIYITHVCELPKVVVTSLLMYIRM